MKKLLPIALLFVAVLPAVGYLLARSRGIERLSPDARASVTAPLDALQRQAHLLDGAQPDAAAVCALNAPRFLTRVPCGTYVQTLRSRLAAFAGGTLDVTSISGNPQRDALVVMGVAAVGPHGNADFAVRMTREDGRWRIADVMRYGRSMFP